MKTSLLLAIALAIGAVTPRADAASINSAYQLRGDDQAMPVQAFDDGRQLYIQLRDPTSPPAPMGPSGPILYRIQGYYMVLPLTPAVTLQAGPYQARVMVAGATDIAPGVVSMTRPVEALDTISTVPATIAPVMPVSAPVALASADVVRGEIEVAGASGVSTSNAVPPAPKQAPAAPVARALSADEAQKAASFAGLRGRALTLKSDGSVAGARAVQNAASACRSAGAKCSIDYRGADAGTILITEKL